LCIKCDGLQSDEATTPGPNMLLEIISLFSHQAS
jgi:hypothetical protein